MIDVHGFDVYERPSAKHVKDVTEGEAIALLEDKAPVSLLEAHLRTFGMLREGCPGGLMPPTSLVCLSLEGDTIMCLCHHEGAYQLVQVKSAELVGSYFGVRNSLLEWFMAAVGGMAAAQLEHSDGTRCSEGLSCRGKRHFLAGGA